MFEYSTMASRAYETTLNDVKKIIKNKDINELVNKLNDLRNTIMFSNSNEFQNFLTSLLEETINDYNNVSINNKDRYERALIKIVEYIDSKKLESVIKKNAIYKCVFTEIYSNKEDNELKDYLNRDEENTNKLKLIKPCKKPKTIINTFTHLVKNNQFSSDFKLTNQNVLDAILDTISSSEDHNKKTIQNLLMFTDLNQEGLRNAIVVKINSLGLNIHELMQDNLINVIQKGSIEDVNETIKKVNILKNNDILSLEQYTGILKEVVKKEIEDKKFKAVIDNFESDAIKSVLLEEDGDNTINKTRIFGEYLKREDRDLESIDINNYTFAIEAAKNNKDVKKSVLDGLKTLITSEIDKEADNNKIITSLIKAVDDEKGAFNKKERKDFLSAIDISEIIKKYKIEDEEEIKNTYYNVIKNAEIEKLKEPITNEDETEVDNKTKKVYKDILKLAINKKDEELIKKIVPALKIANDIKYPNDTEHGTTDKFLEPANTAYNGEKMPGILLQYASSTAINKLISKLTENGQNTEQLEQLKKELERREEVGSEIQQVKKEINELLKQKKENNNLSDDINAKTITDIILMFNDENFNDYPLNKLDTFNKLPNGIQTEILQNKEFCSKIINIIYPFILKNENIEICEKVYQTFKKSFKNNLDNIELPSDYIRNNRPNEEWFDKATEEKKDLIYGFEALVQLKEFSKDPTKDNLDKLMDTIKDIKNEKDKDFYEEQAKKIVDDAIEKIEDFGKIDELLELSYRLEKEEKTKGKENFDLMIISLNIEEENKNNYIENKKIEFIKNKSSEELIELFNNESFVKFVSGYIEKNKDTKKENKDINKKILNAIIANNGEPQDLSNKLSIDYNEAVNEFEGKTYAEEILLRVTNNDTNNEIIKNAHESLEDQVLNGKKIHKNVEKCYDLAEKQEVGFLRRHFTSFEEIPMKDFRPFRKKETRKENLKQQLLKNGFSEQEIEENSLLVTDKEFKNQLESLENNKKKTEKEIKSKKEEIEKLKKEISEHEYKYINNKWYNFSKKHHKKQMSKKYKEILQLEEQIGKLEENLEKTKSEINKIKNQKKQRDNFVKTLKNIQNYKNTIKISKEVNKLMGKVKNYNNFRLMFEDCCSNKPKETQTAFMNRMIRENNFIIREDFKGFVQQAGKLYDPKNPKNKYNPLTNLCSNKKVLNSLKPEQINSLLFGKIFSGNKTIKEIDPNLRKGLVANLNDENFEGLLEKINDEQKEELFGIVAGSIQDHVSNKNDLGLFDKLSTLYNNSEKDLKEKITEFFEQQISNLLKNEEKLKKNPELMNKLLKTAPKEAFKGFEEKDLKKLETIKITPEVKEKLKENFKDRKNCLEIIEGLSVKEEKDVSDFEEEEEEKEEVVTDKKNKVNNDPDIRKQDDYINPPSKNKQVPTTPNESTTQEQEKIERKIKENQEKLEKIEEEMKKAKQKSFGPHPVGCGCGCCGGGCGCCCCKCHCCPCCCSSEISINNLEAYNERTAAIRERNEQLRIANEKKTNAESVEYKNKEENIEATLNFNQTIGLECVEVAENFDKNNSTRTITFTIKENNINKEKTSAVNFLG